MNTEVSIAAKLDVLIRLTALGLCKGLGGPEQMQILSAAGLQPKEIAEMLGTTPNTVSVTLSKLRKAGRKLGKNQEE